MSVVKCRERGFVLLSTFISALIIYILAMMSFKEVLNNYIHISKVNKTIKNKQIKNDLAYENCKSETIHSNLELMVCQNNNIIIIQK